MPRPENLVDRPDLRERAPAFRDRAHAGALLAGMLAAERRPGALVLAIPAGGVEVALPIARALDAALDLAIVSKITMPGNTEAGYGAVAFDGTVRVDAARAAAAGLLAREIDEGIARTREKVERRARELRRGLAAIPAVARREAILVDDGLASGATMEAAIAAVRGAGAARIVVAVPTAHADAAARVAAGADTVYCANVRAGRCFAVADAYERWRDVPEAEVARLLADYART
jgi:predicted phosphoribosyltransferase